jgi:hypothetical protein
MTTGRAQAIFSFLLQLMPLAFIAAYLFMLSKPLDNPSGHAGVAFYRPPGMWYGFPYSILLGFIGIAAIFSRIAAAAASITMARAVAYGLRLLVPGDDPGLGTWLVILSGLSTVGGLWRVSPWSPGLSRV